MTTQRQRILGIALNLMSQRGVDGTSMRDLAAAADLNVATLYHYFPSKQELLVAVLEDRGFLADLTPPHAPEIDSPGSDMLADMMDELLGSMLEVEEFIRLMMGEVMRGDETAHTVGVGLFAAAEQTIVEWLKENDPELCEGPGAAAVARVLRAVLVGMFFEYVAGVLEGDDARATFRIRADEIAAVLRARGSK